MSGAVSLGPLLVPYPLLLTLGAAWLAVALAPRWSADPAAGGQAERLVWRSILVGVVIAPLAFVYEYRALYAVAPVSIADVRDGGWNLTAGLAGAWSYAVHALRRAPALRKAVHGALAVATLVLAGGTAALALRAVQGAPMPDITVQTLDGRPARLHAFLGRPTVVNLWATWCPPCRREMPVLQRAQAARPDVAFVFLNQGEDAAQVRAWLQAHGFALENVWVDPRRQASAVLRQQGYPTTLFFDAQGRLVSVRVGELSSATLAERLAALAP